MNASGSKGIQEGTTTRMTAGGEVWGKHNLYWMVREDLSDVGGFQEPALEKTRLKSLQGRGNRR